MRRGILSPPLPLWLSPLRSPSVALSLSLMLSLSRSLWRSRSLALSRALALSLSRSLDLSLSRSRSLACTLPLSHSLSGSLSLRWSLCISISASLSLFLFLSLSLSLSLYRSRSPYFYLCLNLCLSVCLSVSVSRSIVPSSSVSGIRHRAWLQIWQRVCLQISRCNRSRTGPSHRTRTSGVRLDVMLEARYVPVVGCGGQPGRPLRFLQQYPGPFPTLAPLELQASVNHGPGQGDGPRQPASLNEEESEGEPPSTERERSQLVRKKLTLRLKSQHGQNFPGIFFDREFLKGGSRARCRPAILVREAASSPCASESCCR